MATLRMNIEKRNNIQLESIIANFDEETLTYNECTLYTCTMAMFKATKSKLW